MRKMITILFLAFMYLAPAHANMDLALGMATGIPTGSAMSLVGAQIHNSIEEDDVARQATPQATPAYRKAQPSHSSDMSAMQMMLVVAMLVMCVVMFIGLVAIAMA